MFADPEARHQLILPQLDGLVQRRRAVALDPLRGLLGKPRDELLQYHSIYDAIDVASTCHQPLAAGVPELVREGEGLAGVVKGQGPETLSMLFRTPADPL